MTKKKQPVAKAQQQPKVRDQALRRIHNAIAITPSPEPEADRAGKMVFRVCFVEPSGKLTTRECSKQLYQQIIENRLPHDHRNDFKLRENADGLIVSVDTFPKPELNSVFKTTGEDENGGSLAFQRHEDKTFSLRSVPTNVSMSVAEDISSLLAQYPDVTDGDFLDGRYKVAGVSKRGGTEMVFINP